MLKRIRCKVITWAENIRIMHSLPLSMQIEIKKQIAVSKELGAGYRQSIIEILYSFLSSGHIYLWKIPQEIRIKYPRVYKRALIGTYRNKADRSFWHTIDIVDFDKLVISKISMDSDKMCQEITDIEIKYVKEKGYRERTDDCESIIGKSKM